MELRHLRYFIAVAEELHFSRAAERLHIEPSPLSRAIKELEEDLGVELFLRTTRSTHLTRTGKLFMEHVPRVFTALQQALDSVKAATNGFHGQLRVALSGGIPPSRFSSLLALCRQEEPAMKIHLSEVPLSKQIKGLHEDLYDVGFARSDEVGDGLIAEPMWHDRLMVVVPAGHPLLVHRQMPLKEIQRYPLVLADPHIGEGYARQIERLLLQLNQEPLAVEKVTSVELMMALISAGFAVGLAGASQIAARHDSNIAARPLAGCVPMLTTYLLRLDNDPSEAVTRFIRRAGAL